MSRVKVTITVGTDKRLARATCEHDDEAQALASCIYRIAEGSPSDRVAWIADAVYRLMRGEPEDNLSERDLAPLQTWRKS